MEIAIANHTFVSNSKTSDYVVVSNRNGSKRMTRTDAESMFRRFKRMGHNHAVIDNNRLRLKSIHMTHTNELRSK